MQIALRLSHIPGGSQAGFGQGRFRTSPAHTDAAVKALFDSGVRAVFAYGNGQNETGRYWEIATSKFPGDIARLRKQYFSSDDQLVTLFLAPPRGPPEQVLPPLRRPATLGPGPPSISPCPPPPPPAPWQHTPPQCPPPPPPPTHHP